MKELFGSVLGNPHHGSLVWYCFTVAYSSLSFKLLMTFYLLYIIHPLAAISCYFSIMRKLPQLPLLSLNKFPQSPPAVPPKPADRPGGISPVVRLSPHRAHSLGMSILTLHFARARTYPSWVCTSLLACWFAAWFHLVFPWVGGSPLPGDLLGAC